MQAWSRGQTPRGQPPQGPEEDPVPHEELDPSRAEALGSGSGALSPEQLENIVTLTRNHLPQIEESVQTMEPTILLADDQELPEDMADKILELVDGWGDGLPEMLKSIAPEDAIAVAQALAGEIAEVEPILVGAWLWRAGELT